MNFSIDRFEGSFAVCVNELGSAIDIPISILPVGVREGSIVTPDGAGRFLLCPAEEAKKRDENFNLAEDLFE